MCIKTCPECGKEVNIHDKTCPHCDALLDICPNIELRKCPKCFRILNINQKKCPECNVESEEP